MSSPARAQRRRAARAFVSAVPPPSTGRLDAPPAPGQDQTQALLNAAALGLALDQATLLYGCARCVRREKTAGAAEPRILQAVTWQDGEPVCWDDFEVRP